MKRELTSVVTGGESPSHRKLFNSDNKELLKVKPRTQRWQNILIEDKCLGTEGLSLQATRNRKKCEDLQINLPKRREIVCLYKHNETYHR
jgi:hypothetical protein